MAEDVDPWTKSDMEVMIEKGYTPEYVSLMKWIALHKEYVVTQTLDMSWIDGTTCSLCDKYFGKCGLIDDETACQLCTLFQQMGITCNDEDHPWSVVRFGSINDIEQGMVNMIVQLTKLVEEYGVKKNE